MIQYLLTRGHSYTISPVIKDPHAPRMRALYYDRLIWSRRIPTATYLFTDLDRLASADLDLVGKLYQRLREAGMRVLNNPALVRKRYSLLRALHAAGLNDFNAHVAEELPANIRFPVFVRPQVGHGKPLSGLLRNRTDLQAALDGLVAGGLALQNLIVIEYAGEPIRPGLFRKLAVFRMGDRMVAFTSVHDSQWLVKQGAMGVAGEELYQDEFRIVRDNPFGQQVRNAFEIAHIDYGRADFGILNGRVQVFEINTNPHILPAGPHDFATRVESMQLAWKNVVSAFRGLDSPRGPAVVLPKDRCFRAHRKWHRYWMHTRLVP